MPVRRAYVPPEPAITPEIPPTVSVSKPFRSDQEVIEAVQPSGGHARPPRLRLAGAGHHPRAPSSC